MAKGDGDLGRGVRDHVRRLPDLLAMLKRRSSAGISPRMAGDGLLIASRPVILWNLIAIVINALSVGAYMFFLRRVSRHTTR